MSIASRVKINLSESQANQNRQMMMLGLVRFDQVS